MSRANLFAVRPECSHTHGQHKVLRQPRSAGGYSTEGVGVKTHTHTHAKARAHTHTPLKHICTTAHTAAQSRRVATKLAEQTASRLFVIFPGCLFTDPHELRLESPCEVSARVSPPHARMAVCEPPPSFKTTVADRRAKFEPDLAPASHKNIPPASR